MEGLNRLARRGELGRGCVVVSPRGLEAPGGLCEVLMGRGFEVREVGCAAEVMVELGVGDGEVGSVVMVEPGVLSDAERLGASIKRYYPGVCVWRYAEGESPELGWYADGGGGGVLRGGLGGIEKLVSGVVEIEVGGEVGEGGEEVGGGGLSDSEGGGVVGGDELEKEDAEEDEMFDSDDSAAILTEEELAMLLEDDEDLDSRE